MIQPEAFSLRLTLQVASIMTLKPSSKLIEPTARDNFVGIGLMLLSMFVF